jgi:GntR family transcriptional regulator
MFTSKSTTAHLAYKGGLMFGRSVSLVKQVKEQLYKQIVRNEFASTDGQLPSEPQLSSTLGVSRATIREALTMLEREGIVIRRHGVGTFVNRNLPGVPLSFSEVVEFEDLIKKEGYQADVRVLHTSVKPAGSIESSLQLDSTDEVYVVEKIFLADGNPVIWCRNAIPIRLLNPDQNHNLKDKQVGRIPIYRFLIEHCKQDVIYHVSEVRAAVADEVLSAAMDCEPYHPLLCIEEVGFNSKQEPVLHCLEYYRNDRVRFQTVRKTARPFSWE